MKPDEIMVFLRERPEYIKTLKKLLNTRNGMLVTPTIWVGNGMTLKLLERNFND